MTFDDIISGKGESNNEYGFKLKKLVPCIKCADGATISVQASHTHYCTPRTDTGPYSHVEVGFPSVKPQESMMEYAEVPEDPTGTVYGYVPVEIVREFINLHGGEVTDS